jgi:hypothetical protein
MKKYVPLLVVIVAGCACRHHEGISFSEAKHVQPFRAVVENVGTQEVCGADHTDYLAVEIRLRREDGTQVTIATDGATLFELAFALSLTNGESLMWPKAITDFETEFRAKRQRIVRSVENPKPKAITWNSPPITN